MPKIAFLSPLPFSHEPRDWAGGGYLTNLARGVTRASRGDYQVEVISFGSTSSRFELTPGISLRVLLAAREPTNPLDVLSWDLPDALADVDLVHIHHLYTRCTEVALLVAKCLRKPVCVTDLGAETSIIGRHYGIQNLADQIVADSHSRASIFDGGKPVEVIRGGIDAETFTPSPMVADRSHILYVGRIDRNPGLDRLIRAMPAQTPLVVCGRGNCREHVNRPRDLADNTQIRVIIDATHDKIIDLYRRAWVTVFPSVRQDCDNDDRAVPEAEIPRLFESMACGTPVLGSNRTEVAELILEGETGFVFNSTEELHDQIELLAGTPTLVVRMGSEARRSIETEYSLDVAGAKLMRLYDRLLPASVARDAA